MKKREGKASFLACKDDIRQRLQDGHSQLSIYHDLGAQDKLKIGYVQFSRYINRYLDKYKDVTIDSLSRFYHRQDRQVESGKKIPFISKSPKKAFHHDPDSGDRDDLI